MSLSATSCQTKENIMDAFWELYSKKRLDKITVSEICKLAGYNRSTFYAYFTDVYQVLEEIEEQIITPEEFGQLILHNILYASKKEAIAEFVAFYERKSKYFSVLLGFQGDPSFRGKLMKRLEPVIFTALNRPEALNNNKIEYIMEYQSSAVLNSLTKWYTSGKDIPLEEFIDLLIALTTNGVQKEIMKEMNDESIN